ncbi:type III secretion protein HrpB4 [Paraburkholderia rhynchosiae]|uniref:Type III secretion protein n=1 Tax=Paraburkholderia rhynchosiae TaxID=487049 RepID=A0A2N7W5Y2_9BURK|nr:type III secretion protein HrpB4 [Paraburkholderia rhynchosiae]PMS24810.1 hypothetical protein C0Z16_30170 [Paraburkholderia rhynchosiae]CAB3725641.1 hypothetical protein LMG27174_05340 [Paraburkholderia rhynchosiae]
MNEARVEAFGTEGHAEVVAEVQSEAEHEAGQQAQAEEEAQAEESALADVEIPAASRLLQWLTAYEARIAEAAARSGEEQCRLWGVPFTSDASRAWYVAREVWLGPAVPVSAFAPRANRLALLDGAWLRRVLAARAIYPSRGMLRRIVSGATRRALSDALGEHALAVLAQLGVNAPSVSAALSTDLAVDALARAGHLLFERDDAWTLAPARTLIAIALDRDADAKGASASPDPDESADFLLICGTLFPELTWLFG